MSKFHLSRRDFLKLTGYGLLGMFTPNLSALAQSDAFDNLQGRVVDRNIWSYDAPDFKAGRKKLFWRDLVMPLSNTAVGLDEAAHNRIWYELAEGGFIYSGSVQPVRTILNQAQPIPLQGALGEVTVPFTDAFESLEPGA